MICGQCGKTVDITYTMSDSKLQKCYWCYFDVYRKVNLIDKYVGKLVKVVTTHGNYTAEVLGADDNFLEVQGKEGPVSVSIDGEGNTTPLIELIPISKITSIVIIP